MDRSLFTAEEWAVAEFGCHVAGVSEDIDDAFLYEVHLVADRPFPDDLQTTTTRPTTTTTTDTTGASLMM